MNYPLFSLFPHLLWALVVTDNSPFHGLVIFLVFSAQYMPAVLPLLFRHVQTSSTFSSFLHVSTLLWSSLFRVWDYDDRFLCIDFPFSCLGGTVWYVILSRWCIYFCVKKKDLLWKSEKKVLTVCYFFQRRSIHQLIGSKEKKNIDFYHSPLVLVHAFHLAFMTLFCFTSMMYRSMSTSFSNRFVCCSKEKNVRTEGRNYRKMIFVLL